MKYNNLDCVYRKIGNKYKPIGVCEPIRHIPDGIWFIKHKEHSRSKTSVEYIGEMLKINDADDISLSTQCGLHNIAEDIMASNEFIELLNKGYTLNELVHFIVRRCYDKSNK